MNGPQRLVDDDAADPELARLLRAARPPHPLEAATFERSRRHVVALGSVPAALGVLVWVKHAALGAVLGVVVTAAVSAPRFLVTRDSVAPAPSASVRKQAPTPSRRPRPVGPVATAEPSAAPVAVIAPAPAVDAGLSRELLLLESARAEIERHPRSSLALLSQHEREFPRGALAVEREFLTVSTLVRLGRLREADARAAALRARAPGSLYEQRLDALLGHAGSAR